VLDGAELDIHSIAEIAKSAHCSPPLYRKKPRSRRKKGENVWKPETMSQNTGKIRKKHIFQRDRTGEITTDLKAEMRYLLEGEGSDGETSWNRLERAEIEAKGLIGDRLEAVIYGITVLSRMGYGSTVIAHYLNIPLSLALSLYRSLRVSPYHGFSFDLTLALIRKEILTIALLSDLSFLPPATARLIVKRSSLLPAFCQALQRSSTEVASDSVAKAGWLYVRGLNLLAIGRICDLSIDCISEATVGL